MLKEEILKTLRKKQGQSFKELQGISDDINQLSRSLLELEEHDEIFRNGDGYYVIDEEKYHLGRIAVNRKNGLHIMVEQYVLPIDPKHDDFLYPDDDVIYLINRSKARIIKVIRHNLVYITGKISINHHQLSFEPLREYYTRFKLVGKNKTELKNGEIIRCYISNYERREITIDKILGDENDPDVLVESILSGFDVPRIFPKKVLLEADSFDREITLDKYRDYEDLTGKMLVTIDGDSAKDFDDAIYVERNDQGYRLIVSIADVANYVKPLSNLDIEARKRGTSIYYPNAVIPMLPEELSNDLCSLMPDVNRLTMTCDMVISMAGDVLDYRIYEAIIRSHYRLTYSRVNRFYEGEDFEDKELSDMLKDAKALSDIIERKRKENGCLDFASTELDIRMEGKEVVDIRRRESGIAEAVIENFMIKANETVALHLHYLDYPMIYRVHDNPKPDKIVAFADFVGRLGYTFKGNKLALKLSQLSDCLNSFIGSDEYEVVSDNLLRSMAKAKYSTQCLGHYGLGLSDYCHFTSPIRRYPDLIVHRMIKKYVIKKDYSEMDKDNSLNEQAALLSNMREKIATQIERDIDDLRMCQYLENYIGYVFEATISSVTAFGFFARLDNGIEGLVHIKTLAGYYEYEEGRLYSEEGSYELGQRIKVKIMAVDKLKRNIDMIALKSQRRQNKLARNKPKK
ncbi:MAG: ribonuclease R [Erysipelotrichaceae bacterium]|nr:ribonuclease R [Erysipelotrichaceae bacterium]